MNIDSVKHNLKWDTWIGELARNVATWFGLKLFKTGRNLLKWSLGRCSWCGNNCGFSSTVSSKGLRCNGLGKDCSKF